MFEDLANDLLIFDQRNYSHRSRAVSTHQGINMIDFLDQPRPILAELFGRNLRFDERKQLNRMKYVNSIVERVGEIYEMEPNEILSKGKQQQKVQARSLFCFWPLGSWVYPLENWPGGWK